MRRKLRAYISGALTGVTGDDSRRMYEGAAATLEEHGFTAYVPHMATDPVRHPSLDAATVYQVDREQVSGADLMVAFLGRPSLGVGQELEIAAAALVPVLMVLPPGRSISRMALGNPARKYGPIRAETVDDMARLMNELLPSIRKDLLSREARSVPDIGRRLAKLRVARGMSRDELARRTGTEPSYVRFLETADSLTANPSLAFVFGAAKALSASTHELLGTESSELLRSLNDYARRRGLEPAEVSAITAIAARGLDADRALSEWEWDRIREIALAEPQTT